MDIVSMNNRNSVIKKIIIYFLIGSLIGLTSINYYLLIFTLMLMGLLAISLLTIKFPIQVNIICFSIWLLSKWILMDINIGGLALSQASMFFLFLPLIIGLFVRKNSLIKKSKLNPLLGIYGIMTIWSFLGNLTSNVEGSLILYIRFVIGFLFFALYLKCIISEKELKFIINTLIFTGVFGSLLVVVAYILSVQFGIYDIANIHLSLMYYGDVYRPTVFAGGPIATCIVLFTIMMLVHFEKNKKKLLNKSFKKYNLYYLIMLLAMLATLSRTGILSIIVCSILYLILYNNNKFVKGYKAIVLILFAGFIISFIDKSVFEVIFARFTDFDSGDTNEFGAGRLGIWLSILNGLFVEFNPFKLFIGYGIGMSEVFTLKYSIFSKAEATHNDYLDVFLTSGIVGITLFITFLITIFKAIRSRGSKLLVKYSEPYLIAYCLIILNLSNTTFSTESRWIFLIIISVLLNKYNNPINQLDVKDKKNRGFR